MYAHVLRHWCADTRNAYQTRTRNKRTRTHVHNVYQKHTLNLRTCTHRYIFQSVGMHTEIHVTHRNSHTRTCMYALKRTPSFFLSRALSFSLALSHTHLPVTAKQEKMKPSIPKPRLLDVYINLSRGAERERRGGGREQRVRETEKHTQKEETQLKNRHVAM